ncbi:MAG: hypothetical protein LRY69_07845 [Gammaproteobacteria bacterium]|nr:hypothetical protein [Gammaproteobacteria bacterium]
MAAIILFIVIPLLLLTYSPQSMRFIVTLASVSILLFVWNVIVPDGSKKLASFAFSVKLLLLIMGVEILLFLLCYGFSTFSFLPSPVSEHDVLRITPITWCGLWMYFSLLVTMQHFAYYERQHVAIPAALTLAFRNRYLDTAVRRGLAITQLSVQFTGVYVLVLSLLLTLLSCFDIYLLDRFYFISVLFLSFFLYLNVRMQKPAIKRILNKTTLSNLFYIGLASVSFYAAVSLSTRLSYEWFPSNLSIVSLSLAQDNILSEASRIPILFVAMFILLAPLCASIVVKHSAFLSRKMLLLFSFVPAMAAYLLFCSAPAISSYVGAGLFIAVGMVFLVVLFRRKTTENFVSGILPFPRQAVILAQKSYKLFVPACLLLFNFYLLMMVIGMNCAYAIVVSIATLSFILGAAGIVSYLRLAGRQNLYKK